MPKRFGFGKAEKLKSRKQIEELFTKGRSMATFPLRVMYQFEGSMEPGVQVGVTVNKRHFKRAVDRNRIKRLLREAYRLQKTEFTEAVKTAGKRGHLFFMFTDKTMAPLSDISEAMAKSLRALKQKVLQNENPA